MELNQLNTFYHAAMHLNFTRAAEELAISQPAVSRHIEALEQVLHVKLFHRVGRTVALTDAGKTLFTYSEQILSLAKKASDAMMSINNLESGSLSVGASTTMGNYFLAPIVMKFMKRYPGIQVKMEIKSSQEIQNFIEQNLLDIAILPEPIPSSSLTKEPLLEDRLVLVTPIGHPLSKKESIEVTDLQGEIFLTRSIGSNTRHTIEQYLQYRGVKLSKTVELNSTEAIKQAIITGSGISILPLRTIRLELQLGVLKTVDMIQIERKFYLVHHEEAHISPAIQAFISFMKDVSIKKNEGLTQ